MTPFGTRFLNGARSGRASSLNSVSVCATMTMGAMTRDGVRMRCGEGRGERCGVDGGRRGGGEATDRSDDRSRRAGFEIFARRRRVRASKRGGGGAAHRVEAVGSEVVEHQRRGLRPRDRRGRGRGAGRFRGRRRHRDARVALWTVDDAAQRARNPRCFARGKLSGAFYTKVFHPSPGFNI